MEKPQKMDQQTASELAAMVADELLSSEALSKIIEQCVHKGLEKKWVIFMKGWIFSILMSST